MDLEHVRHLLDRERRTLAHAGEVIEILPFVTRVHGIDGTWHAVTFSALESGNADEVIAEQARDFRTQCGTVEWKAYGHDQPPDLVARLASHGFQIGDCETVLVLDLSCAASWPEDAYSVRVQRVASLDDVELYRHLSEQVSEGSCESVANELAADIRQGLQQRVGYVALDDGVPASVGRLYTHPDSVFGGLYGGATLKDHRGRGLYRALVAARARDAAAAGARYLLVDALPTSRAILERLGFLRLTETWPCVLTAE